MISRQGRLTTRRRKAREWWLNGRILMQGLTLLVVVAILLNIAFFATLTDHQQQRSSKVAGAATSDISKAASASASAAAHKDVTTTNRILATFQEAGLDLTDAELADLPTWDEIEQVVGKDAPIIHNLESCAAYRNAIPGLDRNIGCSGMFNSGTNLVTQLLKENCIIKERLEKYGMDGPFHDPQGKPIGPGEAHGIRWQVPWGKHMPANYRDEHSTKWASAIWKESVLAVVTIRHPYAWMKSMCKNHYSAYWPHNDRGLCPHLVNNKDKELVPVEVKYDGQKTQYNSLVHLWNDWYAQYLTKATFPYIVVRFEDLQFHAKNITYQICDCAGGTIRQDRPFSYIVNSAKDGPGHGKEEERTGMLAAWNKYGKPLGPQNGFGTADYEASIEHLDADFMKMFGYQHPEAIIVTPAE